MIKRYTTAHHKIQAPYQIVSHFWYRSPAFLMIEAEDANPQSRNLTAPCWQPPRWRPQKLALSIPEFLAAVPIGRTKLYEELKAGRLRAVKVGKRTLILITDAERWLATLAGRSEAA